MHSVTPRGHTLCSDMYSPSTTTVTWPVSLAGVIMTQQTAQQATPDPWPLLAARPRSWSSLSPREALLCILPLQVQPAKTHIYGFPLMLHLCPSICLPQVSCLHRLAQSFGTLYPLLSHLALHCLLLPLLLTLSSWKTIFLMSSHLNYSLVLLVFCFCFLLTVLEFL